MLELGSSSIELHGAVAHRAVELDLDGLVVVASGDEGDAMQQAAASMSCFQRVDTPEEAFQPLIRWLEPGDPLLLKASRGVALERLIPLLQAAISPG